MKLPSVSDEELVEVLHKFVGGTCMMSDAFETGCMRCPSQREPMGCVLRVLKRQTRDKIIASHREEIAENKERMGSAQEMIVELRAQNAKHQMEIERLENL